MTKTDDQQRAFFYWHLSAVALLGAIIWRFTMLVGDGYWYIALGRWILKTGQLLPTDPFSFASLRSPFIPHMIGCVLGFAWIDEHAGPLTLIALCAALSSIAWLGAWLYFAKSKAARLVSFYALAAWCAWLGFRFTHFGVRGQIIGDLGTSALMICLLRMREGWKPPFWLPMVLVGLWVNGHPSVLLTLVAPLGYYLLLRLDVHTKSLSPRPFILFSALSLLATGLSVYSFRFLPDILHLFGGRTTSFVDVQRPPDFRSWIMPVSLVSTFALIAARTRWGNARFRHSDVALLLSALLASFLARRHASILALVTVLELALLANDIFPRKALSKGVLLGLTLTNLALATFVMRSKTQIDHPYYAPVKAEQFLAAQKFPDRLFNPYHWGGYLDYRWHATRKVFIDGRNTLYGNQVLEDYLTIRETEPGWSDLLNLYEIKTVLWEAGTKLDQALASNPEWKSIYRDEQAVIYER